MNLRSTLNTEYFLKSCTCSVDIYLFKINYGNSRTMCQIRPKLKIKTSERHCRRPGLFTNINRFHPCFGVFIGESEQVNYKWEKLLIDKAKQRNSNNLRRQLIQCCMSTVSFFWQDNARKWLRIARNHW